MVFSLNAGSGSLSDEYGSETLILLYFSQVSDEVLFKFLKSLGLHEEEKNKKVATAAAATAMDPELLDLFEGDAKYGLDTSIRFFKISISQYSNSFLWYKVNLNKRHGTARREKKH